MFRIRVTRTIDRPIEEVFGELTDHEGYGRFPGVSECELLEHGEREKNGEGAYRRVRSGGFQFFERITEFEPPVRMQYRIVKSSPLPIRNERGVVDLEASGAGSTRVTWISEGRMAVPLIGRLLDRVTEKQGARAFGGILKAIDRRSG